MELHEAVTIVDGLMNQFEEFGRSCKLKDEQKCEVNSAVYALQDCIPVLKMVSAHEVPADVQKAIVMIQDDFQKLQSAQKLFLRPSRVQQTDDAVKALSQHHANLQAQLQKAALHTTKPIVKGNNRGGKVKSSPKGASASSASDAPTGTGSVQLEQVLATLQQHEGSVQSAAFNGGSEKLSIEALRMLAQHWGIDLPKKLKKKQQIIDRIEKVRLRSAKGPLADVSNWAIW